MTKKKKRPKKKKKKLKRSDWEILKPVPRGEQGK
jgi:hypothetical protein